MRLLEQDVTEVEETDVEGADLGDMEDEPAPQVDLDPEEVVAEVVNRVAARLQRENKKEKMADQLAERIMKRLTK